MYGLGNDRLAGALKDFVYQRERKRGIHCEILDMTALFWQQRIS
jgi:hypothetical protein